MYAELHEQLLARASHVEDLEQLKQREKTQHESELEQLRIYFEKKLRDAEKTYQEDLTLLQQRLQGASEDALLDPVEVGYAKQLPASVLAARGPGSEFRGHFVGDFVPVGTNGLLYTHILWSRLKR